MKLRPTNDKHEMLYQELIAAMRKHDLSAVEILAVLSNMVGKALALQDQTKGDADFYMKIVRANLEEGNRQAIAEVMNPVGRS